MIVRKKYLLAIGLVVVGALVALGGLLFYYGCGCMPFEDHSHSGEETEVLLAAVKLEAGTRLERESVRIQPTPDQFLPHNPALASDLEEYLGARLTVDLEADSMLLTEDFASDEEPRRFEGEGP